jgi:hypothetical protein
MHTKCRCMSTKCISNSSMVPANNASKKCKCRRPRFLAARKYLKLKPRFR